MALLPVEEARSRILDGATPTAVERVELRAAFGRVLAQDVTAQITQPPFDASAMDGYALRADDVAEVPATLRVIGEAPAGAAFEGALRPGEAVRIFTGAPVPAGADTIVIQENTKSDANGVTVLRAPNSGQFVRPRGLDFTEGEALLAAGTRLGSREIALAAAMNHPVLPVRRKPKVTILPTGDELIEPGGTPAPDQIVSSNNFGMAAFVEHYGGKAVDLGVVGDTSKALRQALQQARESDILITLGGASVGKHDLVQQALTDSGMTLDFWKIAMRPGKPLIFGKMQGTRVLGLPGNPVSTFVCAAIFLRPLLDRLLGRTAEDPTTCARLGADVGANDERQDYLRAQLSRAHDGTYTATPFPKQDSSMLRTLASADGFVIRPPFDGSRAAGDSVEILICDF
jgi:molybdopterin molybdotransferase